MSTHFSSVSLCRVALSFFASSLLSLAPTIAQPTPKIATQVIAAPRVWAAPRALPTATAKKLRELLADPDLRDARIGLCVTALGHVDSPQMFPSRAYAEKAQPTLFAQDDDKRFMPASNLKLFTAAIALQALGAQKTFSTRVMTDSTGNLYLLGGGDPSLSTADLQNLAKRVAAGGLKRVKGKVIGDGGAFTAENLGGRYPDGWTMDDALWYYGPEVSALSVNRNQLDFTITGADKAGLPATLQVDPPDSTLRIVANVRTGSTELSGQSEAQALSYDRADASSALTDVLTITGTVAPKQKVSQGVAVPNPARWAAAIFQRALEAEGVVVENGDYPVRKASGWDLATHQSPPVRILLKRFLKSSDNLYGEMLLRAAALDPKQPGSGTAARGHQLLYAWLGQNKIATDSLKMADGSGLSRYNLITPQATTQLLAVVEKLPDSEAFWDALPIAGVDGTLGRRMKDSAAQNNARAKTGTFSIVSTLSGYITTRDGHRLAVSLLTNFAREGTKSRRLQDQIYTLLAEARW